jgi:diphthine synthase
MGQVVFVGLGLDSERGISLEGLEETQRAEKVFAEFYTNLMPNFNVERLQLKIGRAVRILTRKELEDDNGKEIVAAAEQARVVFLVPGDPLIATTHVALRLTLAKKGIRTRIVHGASIVSAVAGATGLQSYKFGKSITFPQRGHDVPPSVMDTIRENKDRGLHTLLLLDLQAGAREQLNIREVLSRMTTADPSIEHWLGIGIARIGATNELVKAGKVSSLKKIDFGTTPHSIVFPGKLHFMEEEAIRVLDGASPSDLEALP